MIREVMESYTPDDVELVRFDRVLEHMQDVPDDLTVRVEIKIGNKTALHQHMTVANVKLHAKMARAFGAE